MPVRTDRALVLTRHPYGESSLVVHVLTHGAGRVHLLAKGAYRTTSRYFAVLDLFDTLELEFQTTPGSDLALLRRGEVATRRAGILGDLARYRAGLAILELCELVARAEAPEPRLFERTEAALDDLAAGALPADLVLTAWELALLDLLGLFPALDRCAACGRAPGVVRGLAGRTAFSAGAGGRLCAPCAREARASGRRVGTLPVSVLDAARALWQDPRPAAAPPPERLTLVRDFVERFLDYHLETRPKSHRLFLSVQNRNAPQKGARTAPHER
ncbi:MAG: DNA repair protein RecO [Planctomycetota bacterium]